MTDVTFYASWMSQAEYDHLYNGGKTKDDAFDATSGLSQLVFINVGEEVIYYKVEITGVSVYKITLTPIDGVDPVITVYDAEGNKLASVDTGYTGNSETLTKAFSTVGTYYIAVSYANYNHTGMSYVDITKM
jgi:hypothetical protein